MVTSLKIYHRIFILSHVLVPPVFVFNRRQKGVANIIKLAGMLKVDKIKGENLNARRTEFSILLRQRSGAV